MELTIVTIPYNINSEIFLLQIEAIRKFCKDDFVIEVIDNSSDAEKAEGVRYHSSILELSYRKTNSNSLNGSSSHAFAANLSFQMLKDNGSRYYLYLDHDCIPIVDFSVKEILGGGHVMAGIGQNKNGKTYLWQGCVFLDTEMIDKELVDFNPNSELGLDTGGNLYILIEKYGKDNCVFFNEQYCENPYYHGRYNFYALINNGMFFHCINASHWNPVENPEARTNALINIIREKINSNVE